MKTPENDWAPMLAEKYHGKRALDAAEWIGDALWWFTNHESPDEDFTAEELIKSMSEPNFAGGLPTSSPTEVFPFVLELAAALADFALLSLWDGPPPDEYEERQARSALKLILGKNADLLEE
jgi:hypothetical protein